MRFICLPLFLVAFIVGPAPLVALESPQEQVVTAAPAPATDSTYVPVDLDNRDTVSGKSLVIVAYAVILGLLLIYGVTIVRREKNLHKQALDLKRRIEDHR